MTDYRIPFNKTSLVGKEYDYIGQSIDGLHISGDGYFTKECQRVLEEALDAPKALLTTSCTHALEMAALLLEIRPADEVIVPSFTFVSTINAFALRGAKPVFADIRRDTLNIDESKIESLITSKTRAIIVVHYAGVGCEMDEIMRIAGRHRIQVIEDNAHGLFGKYQGKPLGTFGPLATLSFHETKNFSCGEGGALVINDPGFIERAEIIREKGTNRSKFFRGQVDKYTWVDIGSSYLPSDMLAAFLFAQLQAREEIQNSRRSIWERYDSCLRSWANDRGVSRPVIPAGREQSYHMYYLLMRSLQERRELIEHLKQLGIQSVFHYLPLNISQMGRQFGGKPGDCPVTEELSDCLVRLPFYNSLSPVLQDEIIDAVLSFG